MSYGHLAVDRVRCLQDVECRLGPGFNAWTGANGAGKTSVLEAVHLLGYGRTLRQRPWRELLALGAPMLSVALRCASGVAISLRRSARALRAQVDAVEVSPMELAQAVPSLSFHPETATRWFGEAEVRRRALDFVLFHADPAFLGQWQRWQRVRRQRLAAVQFGDARSHWALTPGFIELGEWLHAARAAMLQRLAQVMALVLEQWSFTEQFDLGYWAGWSEPSLEEACVRARAEELRQRRLLVGPQRADVRLRWQGRLAQSMVSRGQQKVVTLAWILAAFAVLRGCGREVLLLLDDPVAELDEPTRELLFAWLRTQRLQVLLTAVDTRALPLQQGDWRVFHVERGRVADSA